VPQALVLTAIVIAFGVQAFALVLVKRAHGRRHRRSRLAPVHRLVKALVVLPVLVPLATAIACLALRPWRAPARDERRRRAHPPGRRGRAPRARGRSGIQVMQMGGWPAPFGITLVADLLATIMVLLTGSRASRSPSTRSARSTRLASATATTLSSRPPDGVSMAFLTGDLFNLYVAFEVMLMASFVLLALGGSGPSSRARSSTCRSTSSPRRCSSPRWVCSTASRDAQHGRPRPRRRARHRPGVVTTLACLFLVAFGIKAAVFPLFFWLPASYHTPPVAVSALFAGLLTKVGVYALLRAFTLVFTAETGFTHSVIWSWPR